MANDFNPSVARMRHAAELYTVGGALIPGVARGGTWIDERLTTSGETLASEGPTIPVPTLSPGGQRTAGLLSKFNSEGAAQAVAETEASAYWLAQMQEYGDDPTVLDTDAYRHVFKPSATDAFHGMSRSLRLIRDDGYIHTLLGVRARQLGFSFTPRNVVLMSRDLVWEHETYYDLATVVAGTSNPPLIRGLLVKENHDLADADLYAKVTAIDSGVSATMQFKFGSAASYGAAGEIVVPLNTWTQITSTTTIPGAGAAGGAGYSDDPLWVYVPGNQVALDEYRYDYFAPTLWTSAFPVLPAFNEIHVVISIGGTEYRMRSCNLNFNRPGIAPQVNIGRRRLDPIVVQGEKVISGSFDRRMIDSNLRVMLETGTPFALSIECGSRELIASTAFPHRLNFAAGNCQFNGKRATVTSPEDFPEPLNFDVYTDGDDDVVVTVDNSIADMAL